MSELMSELFGDSSDEDEEVGGGGSAEAGPSAAAAEAPHGEGGGAATEVAAAAADASSDSDDFADALDAASADGADGADEDAPPEEQAEATEEMDLRIIKPGCPANIKELKIPKTIAINPQPWDYENFRDSEEQKDDNDDNRIPVANTARWRWGYDSDGNKLKESNARIVKWSDGSSQLMIGGECVLDLRENAVQEHNLVFAKLGGGVIECQKRLQQRVTLRPSKKTAGEFSRFQVGLKRTKEKQKKIRSTTIKQHVNVDEEAKLRKQKQKQKRKNAADAERQRQQQGLTVGFLEERDSDDDSDAMEDDRRRDALGQKRLQAAKQMPSDDSDADIEVASDDGSDEDDTERKFKAPKKKRARITISDSDDEDE
jgi:RNA polymerase-associated protein LEO1